MPLKTKVPRHDVQTFVDAGHEEHPEAHATQLFPLKPNPETHDSQISPSVFEQVAQGKEHG